MSRLLFLKIILIMSGGILSTGASAQKAAETQRSIWSLSTADLDSATLCPLMRTGMESYEPSVPCYKLNRAELDSFIMLVTDSTQFSGGTPMSFQYSSRLTLYRGVHRYRFDISTDSRKLSSESLYMPYNRRQSIEELGGAVYFPFISTAFVEFLTRLEDHVAVWYKRKG